MQIKRGHLIQFIFFESSQHANLSKLRARERWWGLEEGTQKLEEKLIFLFTHLLLYDELNFC